jgi:hypothetical protein
MIGSGTKSGSGTGVRYAVAGESKFESGRHPRDVFPLGRSSNQRIRNFTAETGDVRTVPVPHRLAIPVPSPLGVPPVEADPARSPTSPEEIPPARLAPDFAAGALATFSKAPWRGPPEQHRNRHRNRHRNLLVLAAYCSGSSPPRFRRPHGSGFGLARAEKMKRLRNRKGRHTSARRRARREDFRPGSASAPPAL